MPSVVSKVLDLVPRARAGVSNSIQGVQVSIMQVSSLATHGSQSSLATERPASIPPEGPPPFGNTPTGGIRNPPSSAASRLLVWTERCAAGAALVAFSPALAGVLLAVRFLSGKSPLVAHRRAGLGGEPFWVLKIRTMWDHRESRGTGLAENSRLPQRPWGWIEYLENAELPVVKNGPDPRVTSPFAAFCRRFSLDELPQLIHVMSGRMRLVGPRPLTQLELEVYYGDASKEVLSVPPGITGLWQVMGRNRLTYSQRRRLDRFYVRRFSLKLYWLVLRRTPWCVLRGRDVW
jgi:exopolysaccharide production protein ExoY